MNSVQHRIRLLPRLRATATPHCLAAVGEKPSNDGAALSIPRRLDALGAQLGQHRRRFEVGGAEALDLVRQLVNRGAILAGIGPRVASGHGSGSV